MKTVSLEAHGVTVGMEVDPDDHIGRKLAAGRWYERDLLEDAKLRVRPGTAVDVGAHIGNHSVWFGAVCGLHVVSIEPNEESFEVLNRNVRRNGLDAWVMRAAAGAVGGSGTLVSHRRGNSGMTSVIAGVGPVRVVTIDSLDLHDVAVMKIDVEGAEMSALMGASDTIRRDKPLLYVEADSEARRGAVDDRLRRFGYACFGRFCRTPTYGYAA